MAVHLVPLMSMIPIVVKAKSLFFKIFYCQVSLSFIDLYGVSPMYSQSVIQHPQGLAASDSGFYSTYSPGSIQVTYKSIL